MEKELTRKEMERQDLVDNAIFDMINIVNPSDKKIEWDIHFIGMIRDAVLKQFLKCNICTEEEFYPFVE